MAKKPALTKKVPIIPNGYKIKWSGVFDLEELYNEMFRWFRHYGFSWKETKYRVIEMPGGGQQIEIKWQLESDPDDYSNNVFHLHLQVFGGEVEVNIDNLKKKMYKGSIEYRFEAYVERNTELWNKKALGTIMGMIYEKLIIRSRLEAQEKDFFLTCQKFFDDLKGFLGMYE